MELGRLGVWYFLDGMPAPAAAETAQRIEALGYDTLWIPEAVGKDPFVNASWLLAKVEYNRESGGACQDPPCFSSCSLGCEPGTLGCGVRMPSTSPPLDAETTGKLRAWIADGAQNN